MTDNYYIGDKNTPYEGGQLLHNLLLFGRVCRALGMDVTPSRMVEVARALELIDLSKRQDFYHTLRALIVTRQRDLALFDEAFRQFWRRQSGEPIGLEIGRIGKAQKRSVEIAPPATQGDGDSSPKEPELPLDPELLAVVPTYSRYESLRYKDFGQMSREETLLAQRIMERLPWSLGRRKVRRYKAGKGDSLDLRRAIRQNMRYGGEMLSYPTRRHKIKPRPLVVISDVSGSMERYTRMLLHFTYTLANSIYQVEAFVFSTGLFRVTRHIQRKSVDVALQEVGRTVTGWGGGTDTGGSLHAFNYHWARRVLGRGAVVLVITDGWDRGDPQQLREETARLQRNCYRLMWLNPLLAASGYEPLTRGAQAMLPYVDDFMPIRNLANLETLVQELWRVDWRRPERAAHTHLIRTE